MHYEGKHIIRPPSEADSIILQVTVGCSHNKCTFCGTYKEERFRIKDEQVIEADLEFAAKYCRRQKRVFLADGDVLILSQQKLVNLFTRIKAKLPWVNRISLYGNAKSIRHKSVAELTELKALGLNRVYLGLETGHQQLLDKIRKGATPAQMVEAAERIQAAGLFLSVTVLLGIGGVELSLDHAQATGRLLSLMQPNQIGILTLMLLNNTPLYQDAQQGDFILPDQQGMLVELRTMIEHMELKRSQLQSNHASNYLPLNARMPKDKERILEAIDSALAGKTRLKPENMRAL
ncbi:MAG: radical SAM protein [Desulfobulbaceae bacterium]|nr:radical SAM protein [Desulfobulbaceae bacterium]HIJ79112.1 radical SAM protein [Deltaproteobacteria bacterium]